MHISRTTYHPPLLQILALEDEEILCESALDDFDTEDGYIEEF